MAEIVHSDSPEQQCERSGDAKPTGRHPPACLRSAICSSNCALVETSCSARMRTVETKRVMTAETVKKAMMDTRVNGSSTRKEKIGGAKKLHQAPDVHERDNDR